jgi:hypothetical protein
MIRFRTWATLATGLVLEILSGAGWALLWFVTRLVVPVPLRRANEPIGSRNAAYTVEDAAALAQASRRCGWRATQGPGWLMIEGHFGPQRLDRAVC